MASSLVRARTPLTSGVRATGAADYRTCMVAVSVSTTTLSTVAVSVQLTSAGKSGAFQITVTRLDPPGSRLLKLAVYVLPSEPTRVAVPEAGAVALMSFRMR